MTTASDFAFPATTLSFLAGLKANNEKAWFEAHRADYEAGFRAPADTFSALVAAELDAMTGAHQTVKVYRIHRDVRFSKDKTPYNGHLHISFHPAEGPAPRPGWFFGVQPDRVLLGAGVFEMGGAALDAYRARAAGPEGEDLEAALAGMTAAGFEVGEPNLKRVPAPYAPDHPRGALLRRKSLTAWRTFADPQAALRPGIVDEVMAGFAGLRPLYDWLMD